MVGTTESVRAGTEADAIDGVVPRIVVEPESADRLAAVLAQASRERIPVVIRGGGTRLGWGRTPKRVDVVVSTRRLNRVLAHQHGDLTASVEAGATIRDVNDALGRHRQWLPLEAADSDATIGGAIATNDAGPRRHRHGTPRDLLIGVHLALTDGRVVKAGGNVVKNVAGYDLGKLISGSFGCLAAITSATFKLAPLPAASATAVAAFRDPDALARAAAAISASQLEPTAFDVHVRMAPGVRAPRQAPGSRPQTSAGTARTDSSEAGSPKPVALASFYRLLVQFATTQSAVDAQIETTRGLVGADSFELVTGDAERDRWRQCAGGLWAAAGVIVRASWLPANVGEVLRIAHEVAQHGAGVVELVGRAGIGAGVVRIDADPSTASAAVERFRARSDTMGHVVVLRAERDVKQRLDVWEPLGDRTKLLEAVKRAFDPAGILNAGRGPI